MDEYKRLLGCVKGRDPDLSYGRVNDEIDKIIARYSDPRRILETLICHCEAANQNTEKCAIASIIYAVFVGAVALFPNPENNIERMVCFCVLVALASAITIIFFLGGGEYKNAFVLKCLQCRYESFQYEENQCKKKGVNTSEEHMYIVNVQKRP